MTTKRKFAIALAVALGLFPVVLDTTIVNVGLVPISKALQTDFNNVQWIFISYMLANAAVVSLSGYLGNRFGTKRLFMAGLGLFIITSALCGFSSSLPWLIIFRILQGIGGGIMMPLGMALALQPFAKEERTKAMGIVAVPLLLAPVFGPIIGGLIIDNLSWQTMFFINLPIGLLALIIVGFVLPTDEIDKTISQEKFDYAGLILSTLGVVAIVYGVKLISDTNPGTISQANPTGDIYGWGYWLVWVLLGAGTVLLAGFTFNSLFVSRDPVMDLRQFKRFEFSLSNLVIWLSSIVSFGLLGLIPQFLQSIHLPHLSTVDTGLAILPMGVGTIVGTLLGGGLSGKIGIRWIVVTGGGLYVVGFSQLSNLTPTGSAGDIWLWLFLLGMSVTMTSIPVQALAVGGLKGAELNKASSLLNSTELLVASTGSAVLLTTLLQQISQHAGQLQTQLMQQVAAGGQAPDALAISKLAAEAGTRGMNDLFNVLFYISIGLALLAFLLPAKKITETEDNAADAEASLTTGSLETAGV